MPIERELMSASPPHAERPACQARFTSGTSCTIAPFSTTT
jgi:hypothetical protein